MEVDFGNQEALMKNKITEEAITKSSDSIELSGKSCGIHMEGSLSYLSIINNDINKGEKIEGLASSSIISSHKNSLNNLQTELQTPFSKPDFKICKDSVIPSDAKQDYFMNGSCKEEKVVPEPNSENSVKQDSSTSEPLFKIKRSKKALVGENQERMNYLVQASRYLMGREGSESFDRLSSSLGSLATAIGRKCVLRMTPNLKRQFCKGCGACLIPSVSSRVRLRKNRQKHMVVTCNRCQTVKRFVTNPNYEVWSSKPEADAD